MNTFYQHRASNMTPRQQAQQQAEEAMDGFIRYSKRACAWIGIGLFVVVIGCNNGVDGTGSGYNGEQYSPRIN
jgi:hypothetical protein